MDATLTSSEVIEYVEHVGSDFYDGHGDYWHTTIEKVDGRSLEEIARSVDTSVYALKIFKKFKGTVSVGGSSLKLTSNRFGSSGLHYINARVLTREEVEEKGWAYGDLAKEMQEHVWTAAVKPRGQSNWEKFDPSKDTNISLI